MGAVGATTGAVGVAVGVARHEVGLAAALHLVDVPRLAAVLPLGGRQRLEAVRQAGRLRVLAGRILAGWRQEGFGWVQGRGQGQGRGQNRGRVQVQVQGQG